ncbi:type 1 glutamine amidotransferase domain-containing protein [Sphingomonas citri]|jgi:protease I|uniref:Type 1 glutamine amidotransferase n=1 Tax=Sphingomonas citri TaxID=2862499 RepID=A0ABS7BS35_9SPHN|nr:MULTISPECIES: type 1 glutamine amidotransferase domain-containing protein [Sphingomonas]MBB3347538.1 protease I [Sphingomonas sp. BK069]MBB3472333.1 protease I [Sphingomonas sp. BK345]MBW6532234.1 type 1 glutamine amidotransferase [Sphingomonas citri]
MADLSQARVLMLAADGFETVELFEPRQALEAAGVTVTLASIKRDPIQGMKQDINQAETATPDLTLDEVEVDDYDALVLPGGVANPDKLRVEAKAVQIVQDFMDEDKIVAAICHAPWLLAEADVIDGRRLTGFESIRTDLENAGGEVVDEEVVVDDNLITSRKPDDIPAFNKAILAALTEELGADEEEEEEA